MAELHVEPKKQNSSTWLWILVSLAIVAVVVYFVLRNNRTAEDTVDRHTTSYIHEFAALAKEAESA